MRQRVGICLVLFGLMGCATMPGASIMYSPHGDLLAVGYDRDRSESILKTQRTAEQHCEQQGHQRMQLLSTVTVYQGRFDQTTTEAARKLPETWPGSMENGKRLRPVVPFPPPPTTKRPLNLHVDHRLRVPLHYQTALRVGVLRARL